MNDKIQQYLTRVGDLPAMPEVANAVMSALENPSASLRGLRQIIERDPAIVARLLKVANSALYGFSRKVETLDHAIALLGLRTVKNLILTLSMREVFKRFGLMEKLLFEHCSLSGPTAVRLAEELELAVPAEEVFVAGLLHDIGKIALANNDHAQYEQVIQRTYNEGVSFVEAERAAFGFDHAELGSHVASRWRLPPRLETVIRAHHDPASWATLPAAERELTAVIALNTLCLTRLGVGRQRPVEELDITSRPAWQALDIDPDRAPALLAAIDEEAKKAQALAGS